jgi:hypothetical protein
LLLWLREAAKIKNQQKPTDGGSLMVGTVNPFKYESQVSGEGGWFERLGQYCKFNLFLILEASLINILFVGK